MHLRKVLAFAFAGANVISGVSAKARTLIDPALWPSIRRYTLFSAASETIGPGYACPKPPYKSTVVHVFNITSTTTQATIFRDDVAKEFIVAFPGSNGGLDWTTDFNATQVPYTSTGVYCPGCKAHGGFLKAWNSIEAPLRNTLETLLKQHPLYTVTPTGHSLGGALALLCYSSLRGLKFPVHLVYTYGQPRVFNPKGAAYLDVLGGGNGTHIGQIRRVTHTDDGVPQHPTLAGGYLHCRTEIYELDNPANTTETAKTTWRCYGPEAEDCDRGAAKGQFINAAHGMYSGIDFSNGVGCN